MQYYRNKVRWGSPVCSGVRPKNTAGKITKYSNLSLTMSQLIIPPHYQPLLDQNETEQGIKVIKDFFPGKTSLRVCACAV